VLLKHRDTAIFRHERPSLGEQCGNYTGQRRAADEQQNATCGMFYTDAEYLPVRHEIRVCVRRVSAPPGSIFPRSTLNNTAARRFVRVAGSDICQSTDDTIKAAASYKVAQEKPSRHYTFHLLCHLIVHPKYTDFDN